MKGLHDLVAAARGVSERVDPDVDAGLDDGEQPIHQVAARHEQEEAQDYVGGARGRHVKEQQEDEEEEERGTQVALEHHDPEGNGDHTHHRRQVGNRRQAQGPDPRVLFHEKRPEFGQIARQEHDNDDLQQFRRLPAERAEPEDQTCAVHILAPDEREDEERDANRRPGVLVQAQPGIRADHDCEDRDDCHGEQEPQELNLAEAKRHASDGL